MSRRIASFVAAAGALASIGAFAAVATASTTSSLPTLKVALTGVKGVSVSGSMPSGAVNVVSTFAGKAPSGPGAGPAFGLVRLNPGVTIQQAAGAVQRAHGDINALDPYGALLVSADAPGTLETVLTPGDWVALNTSGNGNPGFAPFTVTTSSSTAALPAAQATQTSIEFGFRGPTVLRDGTMVRAQNGGYLVHMISLNGVKSKAAGIKLMAVLRTSPNSFKKARPYLNGAFLDLLGPASHGRHATDGAGRQAWLLRRGVLHGHPGRA